MAKYEELFGRSQNAKEMVSKLRKDIILGKHKPGTRLIEAKLAEQFGVSRAPVRAAFQLLAQEGLVLNLSNGGTEVVGCSVKDVSDLFDLRLTLERNALEYALEAASFQYRPLFDAMELFDEYNKKAETQEITSYETSSLDIVFHRSLILLAQNNPLLVAWNTMANMIQAILEITNMTSFTFQEFYNNHSTLAHLIIQKNPACIEELDQHIGNAKKMIIKRIEKSIV